MPGQIWWGPLIAGHNYKITKTHIGTKIYTLVTSTQCYMYVPCPALKIHKDLIVIKVLLLWSQKSFIFYMELITPCDEEYADWCAICHCKDMPLLQASNCQFRAVECQCQTLISQRSVLLFWKSKWTLFSHFCILPPNTQSTANQGPPSQRFGKGELFISKQKEWKELQFRMSALKYQWRCVGWETNKHDFGGPVLAIAAVLRNIYSPSTPPNN